MLANHPLLVFVILVVALPLAALIGSRLPRHDDAEQSGTATAALGLLALLIAFTFSMAAERYETRRSLAVDEANAISTSYLRYGLLDEPYRTLLANEMAPYVATRLAFADASVVPLRLKRNEQATTALQGRIWSTLGQALRTPQGAQYTVPLLTATNEMFDLAASRQAAAKGRVPAGVRISLMVFAVLVAVIVGWSRGAEWSLTSPSVLLFLLFAATLALIADIDLPGAGLIRVPQSAMQSVVEQILEAHAPPRAS